MQAVTVKSRFSRGDKPSPLQINHFALASSKNNIANSVLPLPEQSPSSSLKTPAVAVFGGDREANWMIKVLKKMNRSRAEVDQSNNIFSNIKFFEEVRQNLSTEAFESLTKRAKYEHHKKGAVIFSEGDLGTKFYFILKGAVYLLVNRGGLHAEPGQPKAEEYHKDSASSRNDLEHQTSHPETAVELSRANSTTQVRAATDVLLSRRASYRLSNTSSGANVDPIQALLSAQLKFKKEQSKDDLRPQSGRPSRANSFASNFDQRSRPNSAVKQLAHDVEPISAEDAPLTQARLEEKFPHLKLHKELGQGVAFGEIALMTHARRTGTVVCREDTDFMTLDKATYDRILGEYHYQKYAARIEFLRSIDIFNTWTRKTISAFLYLFEEKCYCKDNTIYEERDASDYFYVIKEGDIELSKIVSIPLKQSKKSEERRSLSQVDISAKQRSTLMIHKRVAIAKLVAGSYFGEEEVLEKCPRTMKATVISASAEVYRIPTQVFFENLRLSDTLKKLRANYLQKKAWRQSSEEKVIGLEAESSSLTPSFEVTLIGRRLKGNEQYLLNLQKVVQSPDPNLVRFQSSALDSENTSKLNLNSPHQRTSQSPEKKDSPAKWILNSPKNQALGTTFSDIDFKTRLTKEQTMHDNDQSPVVEKRLTKQRSQRISQRFKEKRPSMSLSQYLDNLQKTASEKQSSGDNDYFRLQSTGHRHQQANISKSNMSLRSSVVLTTDNTKQRDSLPSAGPEGKRVSPRKTSLETTPSTQQTRYQPKSTYRHSTDPSPARLSRTPTLRSLLETNLPQIPKKDVRSLCNSLGLDKLSQRTAVTSNAFRPRHGTRTTHHTLSQYEMAPINSTLLDSQVEATRSSFAENKPFSRHNRSASIKKQEVPVNIHMKRLNESRGQVTMANFSYYVKNNRKTKASATSSSIKKSYNDTTNFTILD